MLKKICKKYWYNSIPAVLLGMFYWYTYDSAAIGVFAAASYAVGITAILYFVDHKC